MRTSRIVGAAALLPIAWLGLWPVDVEPVAWTPPPAPALEGTWARNQALDAAEVKAVDVGHGPEHLAVSAEGRVAVGYRDGRVVTFDKNGGDARELGTTGGRPLGLIFRGTELIIADADKGLLSMAPDGKVTVLATEADGGPLLFTDGVDVAKDGTLYFTDASSKFPVARYEMDLLEHGGHGRLLALSPGEKRPRVLLKGLQFPNGVAMAADDSFVMFAETGLYRVSKLWLTGARAGQVDVVIDNMPGFPDNLSRTSAGAFWVGLTAPRNKPLDVLGPHPFLRKVVARLPKALQPKGARFAHVVAIDENGKVLHNLMGTGEKHAWIAGAVEHDGVLYLASLSDPHWARLDMSALVRR